ncbi:hypothetical protein LSUE1_G005125 [Lachnellula suecica]|uniref:BZIP transcription factor n=1 Tax=Lachnellula suecica TaxID=602035 RepID=A0A8T9C7M8_9HELO|nr:hypothetical protein LSUE1_G005125 [Lachnellula suecica]
MDANAAASAADAKSKAGRKPKVSGTRSVTTLSEEALARKRAADRASQRTLRQRTRERIEGLEARIKELEGDTINDPEYEALEEKNLELEKELERLKEVQAKLDAGGSSAKPTSPDSIELPLQLETPKTPKIKTITATHGPITPKPPTIHPIPPLLVRQPSSRIWELPPALRSSTGPIENILFGMVQDQRSLFREGIPGTELAGPRIPCLNALVMPGSSRSVHNVARVISELLNRITYRTWMEKLGAFVIMYPVYQWLIMQSYETYSNLPSWLLPRLAQRTRPHPVWITGLGFPRLREVIVENQERYDTEDFQFLFVESLNVNWPHGIEAALTWTDGDVFISKQFWDHTRNFENWSMNEPFQSRYPELSNSCKFTQHPETGASSSGSTIPIQI